MARIRFLPDDRVLEVEPTESILQASLRSGIPHTHVCGGNARCSTCRVLIVTGGEHCRPRNDREQQMADRLHFTPEIRLAPSAFPRTVHRSQAGVSHRLGMVLPVHWGGGMPTILDGEIPPRALGLVMEWARLNREALLDDWERARASQPLFAIDPLI